MNFSLPSLSLLRKITKGSIDAVYAAKALKSAGYLNVRRNVFTESGRILWWELIGSDENNELYKGLSFMIDCRFERSVPYVIKNPCLRKRLKESG